MKTIETSLLNIAYEELNPTSKRCVILLHGWPDSPRTWNGIAPELAKQGCLSAFAQTTEFPLQVLMPCTG